MYERDEEILNWLSFFVVDKLVHLLIKKFSNHITSILMTNIGNKSKIEDFFSKTKNH